MPQSADPAAYPAGSDPAFTLTGGPAGATAATLAALGRPILHHLDPPFGALYAETVELLRRAFETEPSPVILQGEAVVGLEAAAASLIGAGDAPGQSGAFVRLEWPAARGQGGQRLPRREPACHYRPAEFSARSAT